MFKGVRLVFCFLKAPYRRVRLNAGLDGKTRKEAMTGASG
jgi:hypothetical protein